MKKLICSLLSVVLMLGVLGMHAGDADAAMGTGGPSSPVHQVVVYVPGGHGSATPATQDVADGGSATIVIAPGAGYHLVSLTDNGRAISPLPSAAYAITGVTADHVIGAAFSQNGIRDTVTIAYEEYPESLFPLVSDYASTSFAANFLMANPVSVTSRGELYANLCSTVPTLENGDMVRNDDGTVVTTVRLRSGLKWSDGQPLNIDDYIFSHKLAMSSAIQVVSRSPMYLVTHIDKLDDLTCRVTWKSWDAYIPVGWSIYPQHVLGPQFDKDAKSINTSDYNNNPVHAGPYVLESRVVGQSMTFVANPFYWQPGKPLISKVVVSIVDNTDTLLALMKSGEIDVSSEFLTLDLAQQFEQKMGKDFNVYYNKGTTAGIMEWNLTSAWFKDKRVRQAFYYGIDRKLITQKAMVGTDAVLSPLFSGSVYFKSVLDKYTYDPDQANRLLDAAGWTWNAAHTERVLPDGSRADLKIPCSAGASFRIREVTLMQPMLAKLGITIEQDPMDFYAMLAAMTAGTLAIDLHGISFSNYDAFGSINQFHSNQIPTEANGMQGQNNYRYNSPEMDKWIDAAQKATTAVALKEAYANIQDIFGEDLPCMYLEQRVYPDEVRKGIKGYDHFFSSTVYSNWNVQDWSWSTHFLTANVVGSGSVSRSPDQSSYAAGTIVTVTATPGLGWQFVGWTGAVPIAADPLKGTVSMDADKAITATFQPIVNPPPAVSLSSPANGSTVALGSVTFAWSSVSTATKYELALCSGGGSVFSDHTVIGTSQTWDFSLLGTLTWKVRAGNNNGNWTDWSPVWSLVIQSSTAVPAIVQLSSPTDGTTVSTPTVSLSWNSSSNATSYNVALDTSRIFTNPVIWSVTATSQTTSALSQNTTYYWRVASVNASGFSPWSPVFSFTTTKPPVTLTLALQLGNTRMFMSGSDGTSETVTLDAAPVLGAGNRTLVPVRAVAEAMGGTVDWNATTRTARVTVGSNSLELTLGKNTALFNGTATPIDTDPKVLPLIINGRTMLPLRFVVESLGAEVSYDQATKTITITYTKS